MRDFALGIKCTLCSSAQLCGCEDAMPSLFQGVHSMWRFVWQMRMVYMAGFVQ